jgi:acetyl esterase/lipase
LDELRMGPKKLMIVGSSAGGELAQERLYSAVIVEALNCAAQILICPVLGDQNETFSSNQYIGEGFWSRGSNITGWACLLGGRLGS